LTNVSITLLSKILKKAKSLAIYAAVLFFIFLSGCKKDLHLNYSIPIFQNPIIRLDNYFPKGVLEFKSKESLRAYWDSLQANPRILKLLTPSFRSINYKYEAFYKMEVLVDILRNTGLIIFQREVFMEKSEQVILGGVYVF
jgi:hypothetical protein